MRRLLFRLIDPLLVAFGTCVLWLCSLAMRLLDRKMVPQMCTRPHPHDGPCNGFPRAGCPTYHG